MVPCRKAERDDIVFRIAEPKVHAWLLTTHSDSREWQENIALFLGLRSDLGGEACCAQPSESMLGRTRAVAPTCAGSLPTQSGCLTALCQCTRPVPSPVHMYSLCFLWSFRSVLKYMHMPRSDRAACNTSSALSACQMNISRNNEYIQKISNRNGSIAHIAGKTYAHPFSTQQAIGTIHIDVYIYISYIHICFGSRACPNDLVQHQPSERSITMKSQKGHSR